MVTTKDKYPCPICGDMISKQGVAGHNKSKKHQTALAEQNAKEEPQEPLQDRQEVQQTKPAPTITQKPEIKPEVKQTKIESIKTTKPEQEKQEIKQDAGYNGLEWD